ncbi:MAG: hypothetical protein SVU88_00050 [Candidatus Nanohaloarchaea archaeon]|nr:hypothetical protein [Candidatus Nanohaloarchaea archaeon]
MIAAALAGIGLLLVVSWLYAARLGMHGALSLGPLAMSAATVAVPLAVLHRLGAPPGGTSFPPVTGLAGIPLLPELLAAVVLLGLAAHVPGDRHLLIVAAVLDRFLDGRGVRHAYRQRAAGRALETVLHARGRTAHR